MWSHCIQIKSHSVDGLGNILHLIITSISWHYCKMINEYAKAHPLENRKEKQRNRERTTSRIQQRAPAKIFSKWQRNWRWRVPWFSQLLCSPPCYFGMTESIRERALTESLRQIPQEVIRCACTRAFMRRKSEMSNSVACVSADHGHVSGSALRKQISSDIPFPLSIADRWSRNFPFERGNTTNPTTPGSCVLQHPLNSYLVTMWKYPLTPLIAFNKRWHCKVNAQPVDVALRQAPQQISEGF